MSAGRTLEELHAEYLSVMHEAGSAHPSPKFTAVVYALKLRGIGSLTTLERRIAEDLATAMCVEACNENRLRDAVKDMSGVKKGKV